MNIHKVFTETVKRAKINKITFHQLRHSAATRMVEKGIDLIVVMYLLGHSNIKMVTRYAHPLEETKKKAISILDKY